MFFVLSKVLWVTAAPTNVLLALALAGAVAALAGRRWGVRLAVLALAVLLLCGVLPVGRLLLRPLEDRFPQPSLAGPDPAGIIVLGGAVDQVTGAARGPVSLIQGAERLTTGASLARRYPGVPLIYTGGSNALLSDVGGEAEDAKRLWIDLGVAPARIETESGSRNTVENARFTRDLAHPRPGQRWLLVTSAYHMPRSVGLFRAAGFDVVPVPVDYRSTDGWRDLMPSSDIASGLVRLDMAVREWVGLVAYRLSGRISAVLPAP
ncbi:MAG: YdcF family protein [Janthinobacterium lividum]